jgi:type I restriction enzyme, S subunit
MELVAMKDALSLSKGYKQTEVGLIPIDWDVKYLAELGENIIGLTYSPNNVKDYGHLVLRSSNIQNNKLAFENNVFVEMDLPQRVIVKENDILICVRNGSKNLIGKCALIDKQTEGSAFGAFMSVYRTDYSSYIFYQFQSNLIQKQIDEVMGATINQLTNKDLATFQIPIPPTKAEQTAIATALSDADTLISSLEKLIVKKRNIKQGAMQKLLQPKAGWEVKKLGDYLDYIQPTEYLVTDTEYNDNNQTPVLTAGKTFILGYTNEEHGIFNNLPVIIFDDFTTAIKYVDFPFKAKSSAMKMLVPKHKDVNLRFIYELMLRIKYPLGDHKRHWIGEYRYLEIILPSSPLEQNKIATILSDMDAEITALETKLEKYKKVKLGMMQNLLTGKIRLI